MGNIDNPFEFFQKLIHPEDLGPAFENFFEKLMSVSDDDTIETEYRMFTKEEKVVWFSERVKVFKRDEEGNVWQYINVLQDITARKMALEAEAESDMLFRSLYEKNSLGVSISDEHGKVIRFNDMFAQMLGYTNEEMIGKSFFSITHPDEIKLEKDTITTAVQGQLPFVFIEKRYIHKNGQTIWANVNMSLLYREDGSLKLVMAMIEDITDKKKIRLALENSETFQKAVLNTLPDLKFRISSKGDYIDYYPSPNDEQDLLIPPEDFLGKKMRDVIPAYIANAMMSNVKKAFGDQRSARV